MSGSPIGALMLDAERRGKKKSTGTHTSQKDCGCEVEVSWFSENSRRVAFRHCSVHATPRPTVGSSKPARR